LEAPPFVTHRRDLVVETVQDESHQPRRPYSSDHEVAELDRLLSSDASWPIYLIITIPKDLETMSKGMFEVTQEQKKYSTHRAQNEAAIDDDKALDLFKVTNRLELAVFESVIRFGFGHLDIGTRVMPDAPPNPGFAYLGKTAHHVGLAELKVHWHSNSSETHPFSSASQLYFCPLSSSPTAPPNLTLYLDKLRRLGKPSLLPGELQWVKLVDLMWVLQPGNFTVLVHMHTLHHALDWENC
jgi:hypothetical protein